MIVSRTKGGGWLVTDIVDGFFVHRRYYWYSKREAMRLFARAFPYSRKHRMRIERKVSR